MGRFRCHSACTDQKTQSLNGPLFFSSVPTFTVHPGVACPPTPLMIIDNNVDDDDEDDEDDDDDDEEPSVPLEQYRAWLGTSQSTQRGAVIISAVCFRL